MREVYLDALRELTTPYPAIQLPDWPMFNDIVGGFREKEFSILCGSTGCLSGETKIRLNRGGKGYEQTIRELYEKWNGFNHESIDRSMPTMVRSFNGVNVGLHPIKDVFLSGIKETWRLRTKQNHSIRLTPNHQVLTFRGWVKAIDLVPGDLIAFDSLRPRKTVTQRAKIRDSYFQRAIHHPYSTKCNDDRRIVQHRAIYEANLNGLSIGEFLDVIRNDAERAKTLQYVNPKKFHVHHKNHDHYDNRVENLEIVAAGDHLRHHGNAENFNAGTVRWTEFECLDLPGVEAVYDIECEDPHHNFVANGVVVHNSGKTTLLANISAQLLKQGVKHFVMSVETGHTDFMKRVISVLSGADLNTGEAVDPELLKRVHRANERYLESDTIEFSLYEDRIPVEQLKADILWMVEKRGCRIVFIDNLNFFMEVTRAADAIIEMDRVVHELVIFCKQVPVHIVMVMHPRKTDHTSRNGTRILDENMIRGSALANQEAHNIFLWNRPDADMVRSGERSPFNRELTISKMRRRGVHTGKTIVFDSMGTRYIENRVV
jgi:hypothetical protein